MKLAFSSNAFRQFSLIETIEILAEVGYQGIEIMADVPHAYPPSLSERDISAIRRALDRRRMEISNINAFMLHAEGDTYHPSWIENNPEYRRRRVEHTLNCIELAARLGAKHLSTEPGGPLENMPEKRGLELFLEGLLTIQDKAAKNSVRILIEPEPDLLIETSGQFESFMAHLDPAIFGLNFDIGHFYCVGEDPAQLVKKLKNVTHHFHLEDIASSREHFHLLPGKGAIDLPAVLHAIRESDYDDYVTVELYTYEDKPIAAACEALHYLKTCEPYPHSASSHLAAEAC